MRSNLVHVFALGLLALTLSVTFAMADPYAPVNLNEISSTRRDLSTLPATSVNAQGGNVTEVNINTLTITKTWQGYFGNVTGQIALQDGGSNTFYNWTLVSPRGQVYATRSNAITWTGINCTDAANRTLEETYLNQTAADGDSVTNTFNGTTHPAFTVGTNSILVNTCYSTRGYVNNNTQASNFVMVLLNAGNDIVYTTLLNSSTTGFDGNKHDFELLVGENERNNTAVTPYYFWVELN